MLKQIDVVSMYLNITRNVLKSLGLWLPPKSCEFLYRVYSIFTISIQYSFLLLEIIYIGKVWGDLDVVSNASYILFTQVVLCYKATAFLLKKENLAFLLELMESETFKPESEKHLRFLKAQASTIKRLSLFFGVTAVTAVTMWGITPLLDKSGNRYFPFNIWMPVGPEKSPQYELGYMYQMISVYVSPIIFTSVDNVVQSMIMFGCAQIQIIIDKLEKIEAVPPSFKVKSEKREEISENNYKLYLECVKRYQALIRFIEKVEETYNAHIFFQLSISVADICIIGLRIIFSEKNSVQFYSMLVYMLTILTQLYLYCWCGHELTTKSEELRERLYQCPWYDQDKKFTKVLLFSMQRMMKPIVFKAGHYIALSRPTFVTILRMSYSYFAVLNRSQNE